LTYRATSKASTVQNQHQQQQHQQIVQQPSVDVFMPSIDPLLGTRADDKGLAAVGGAAATGAATAVWTADPNEPRYCICNDVSYGDMVGCDNEDVSTVLFTVLAIKTLIVNVVFRGQ